MTVSETKLLNSLFKFGIVTVIPNSRDYITARRLCSQFGLIERETMSGGVVVYQYRINTEAFNASVFNGGSW